MDARLKAGHDKGQWRRHLADCADGAPPSLQPSIVMAGFSPAIHDFSFTGGSAKVGNARAKPEHDARRSRAIVGGYVYLMTNRPNGTLYCGVTNNMARRAFEHREGMAPGFTRKYGLKRLVWFEHLEDMRDAIQRETAIKR